MPSNLRSRLIRLAHSEPGLRVHLLPILREGHTRTAFEFPDQESLSEYLKEHPDADKKKHWVKKSPSVSDKVLGWFGKDSFKFKEDQVDEDFDFDDDANHEKVEAHRSKLFAEAKKSKQAVSTVYETKNYVVREVAHPSGVLLRARKNYQTGNVDVSESYVSDKGRRWHKSDVTDKIDDHYGGRIDKYVEGWLRSPTTWSAESIAERGKKEDALRDGKKKSD